MVEDYGATMVIGAAFFDLDRTLLSGASGPVLSEALRKAGVVTGRAFPGENALYRLFNTVGETHPVDGAGPPGGVVVDAVARGPRCRPRQGRLPRCWWA